MPLRAFKKIWPVILVVGILFAFSQLVHSQETQRISPPDSLPAPSDTLAGALPQKRSGLDSPITYSAQEIENLVARRITILTGKAEVKYKTATLQAGRITVDWDNNLLIAEPLPDSLRNGQAPQNGVADSTARKLQGIPVFADAGDRMSGEKMEFNFATERGRVLRGRTQFDDGKYFGGQIKRVDDNVLNISHGSYSTCDIEEHPHFHFQSRRMKIIVNDKVIARPVVFYLGDIPLMIIPFAWFPIQTGRQSGLIVPRYGQSQQEGRFLRDLGYYWAINDYLDARMQVDFFERSGWYLRSGLNYNKRYQYSGNVQVSFTDKNFSYLDYTGGTTQQQRLWTLSLSHSQQLGQRSSLRAQGYFVNDDNVYKNLGESRASQLTRRLQSNATYSTALGDRGSVSFNLSDQRDLENGSRQQTLPGYNFNWAQSQIFPQKINKKKNAPEEEQPWYSGLYYSFSSSGDYRFNKLADSLETEAIATARHALNLSLNSPKRFFGWLYLSQNLPINVDWFDRTRDYFLQTDSTAILPVSSRIDKGFATRQTFSYSLSANTKMYGTFNPRLGPVRALRHVVTPSLSFSYRPDFSDPFWGYYEEITLPDSSTLRFDRFGGTGQGKTEAVSFSVGNLFQMKTGPDDQPKKIDLFTVNFSSAYNFAAPAFKHSNLFSTLQANPYRNLSLGMSASHSFYDYDRTTGATLPILLRKTGGFLRLANYTMNASLRLQGSGTPSVAQETDPRLLGEVQDLPSSPANLDEKFFYEQDQRFTDNSIPWNVSLAFNLSFDQTNPLRKTKRAQLSLQNGEVRLTKNWRVGVSAQFDLINKEVFDQHYSIYRDLHCWEMQVLWTPTGIRKGFYMRVNIKSSILRDVKVEKRGGGSSVFGSGVYQ